MNEYPMGASLDGARQQFEALVRRGVFKPCERFICCDGNYEDRVQEGLGLTWRWYEQQVAAGNVPDTALVVFAARRAMVNRGRTLVGHEHRRHDDVYDRQGLDVELRRLDAVPDHDDDDERREQDPMVGLARSGVRDPGDHVISAMDLAAWLDTLPSTDRDILEMRGAGYGLGEIGKVIGRSVAGTYRRARQLGCELAERAGTDLPPAESRSRGAAPRRKSRPPNRGLRAAAVVGAGQRDAARPIATTGPGVRATQ